MMKSSEGQKDGLALLGQEFPQPSDVRKWKVEWAGPVVCEFDDGWKMRELEFPHDYEWEGAFMGHCLGVVAGHYRRFECFHLEDEHGVPHVTVVAFPGGKRIYEIRGRGNTGPRSDYRVMVQTFLDQAGIEGDDINMPYGSMDEDDEYHEKHLTSYIITGIQGVYGA